MPSSKRRGVVRLEDFSALEEPHPYGVLPGGNRFFTSQRRTQTEHEFLSDGLWQDVLSFCDGQALARIVQVSRYLYVAGHQPELWRDLVLRRCEAEHNKVIDIAEASWKDTYVQLFYDRTAKPHVPMPVRGIYSDEYYRTHLCRSFAIPEAWLSTRGTNASSNSNIIETPSVSVELWTPQDFMEKCEQPNTPVVVMGAGRTKALDRWQDPKYLERHNANNKSFRTTSGGAPLSANFTLEAYQAYSQFGYLEESPLYLFDRTAFDDNDQWKDDFFPEFYEKCPYWDPLSAKNQGHDLLQHLGAQQRPDHTWLIMGPKRSGSVFHIDPNATHAWNVCIAGRKRWIFYPPGVNPPGVFPSADGDEVALPLSVGEWVIQYWTEHVRQYKNPKVNQRPMECTVYPGDVVFVPHGWWHMVINLDDQNIAITHNYVSPSNLGNVLKFMADKQDQISGCRDRAESVKPERLYEELTKVLQQKVPQHLTKALAQAQSGWTCRAWNDDKVNTDGPTKEKGHKNNKRSREEENNKEQVADRQSKSVMAKVENVTAFSFSFM